MKYKIHGRIFQSFVFNFPHTRTHRSHIQIFSLISCPFQYCSCYFWCSKTILNILSSYIFSILLFNRIGKFLMLNFFFITLIMLRFFLLLFILNSIIHHIFLNLVIRPNDLLIRKFQLTLYFDFDHFLMSNFFWIFHLHTICSFHLTIYYKL